MTSKRAAAFLRLAILDLAVKVIGRELRCLPVRLSHVRYARASERVRIDIAELSDRHPANRRESPKPFRRPQTTTATHFNQAIGQLRKMYRKSRSSPGAGHTREEICS